MGTDLSDNEKKIVDKRYRTLLDIWDKASANPYFVDSNGDAIFCLNKMLLGVVVSHYIHDLRALKLRYGIDGKIQFPKVAGLITSSIVKYKPLVPVKGDNDFLKSLIANEVFAVLYGLCVLFDIEIFSDEDTKIKIAGIVKKFLEIDSGKKWRDRIHYLLNCRNYTAESLIAVFETLCINLAPELLMYEGE